MHKELAKATAEQIKEQLINASTVGGNGSNGAWAFQLSCKLCRDLGVISTTANGIKSPKEKVKASIKFSKQGWRIDGYELVCPKCYKERY